MNLIYYIFSILIGYAFGCFQSSYFLGKWFKGIDIREHGNSNAGASNTTIVLGWKFGILVGILDVLKGLISILLMMFVIKGLPLTESMWAFVLFLNATFVILGHNFPFFMGFKGGKGTASFIGIMIAIDWKLGILCFLIILFTTLISNFIALGTINMMIISTILVFYIYSWQSGICMLALSVMSIYLHVPNIKRIRSGTETGLRSTLKKKEV